MEIHKLYGDWSQMKTSVVKAAEAFLVNRNDAMAEKVLTAMLIAEKNAREAFEAAYLAHQGAEQ